MGLKSTRITVTIPGEFVGSIHEKQGLAVTDRISGLLCLALAGRSARRRALVALNGSIDFLCFPRFDSPSIFANLRTELLEERKREEHIPTDSKYFLSLLMFDLATRCPHFITGQVVNEPELFFYKVVDEIVREFPTARNSISSWLKHRIQELRGGASPHDIPPPP